MNRLLSWLLVPGLAAGISACDKTQVAPLPKMGAAEVKQQASEAVGTVQNAAVKEKDAFVAAVENDVQATKAKISRSKSRIANTTGKAKAAIEQQITALEEKFEGCGAEADRPEVRNSGEMAGLATGREHGGRDHLKQSVQKAQKDSA